MGLWHFLHTEPQPRRVSYPRCVICQSGKYTARGRGEVVRRWGEVLHRQYFTCDKCGTRYLYYRLLGSSKWASSQMNVRS